MRLYHLLQQYAARNTSPAEEKELFSLIDEDDSGLTCSISGSGRTQTGIPVPSMTQSDNLVTNFLTTYGIPAATFAIAKVRSAEYLRYPPGQKSPGG